jgi:hypothetical protein
MLDGSVGMRTEIRSYARRDAVGTGVGEDAVCVGFFVKSFFCSYLKRKRASTGEKRAMSDERYVYFRRGLGRRIRVYRLVLRVS